MTQKSGNLGPNVISDYISKYKASKAICRKRKVRSEFEAGTCNILAAFYAVFRYIFLRSLDASLKRTALIHSIFTLQFI